MYMGWVALDFMVPKTNKECTEDYVMLHKTTP